MFGNYVKMTTMNTTIISNKTLMEIKHEEIMRHVPVLVFLITVCLAGICGNVLVIRIYKTKYRPSNFRTFVVALSAVDLFSVMVVIPTEFAHILMVYTNKYASICKLFLFLKTLPTITSGFLLFSIAIDRYRKVCRHFGWQISQKVALRMCLGSALLSIVFSLISPIIYDIQIKQHGNYQINVSVCTVTDEWRKTALPLVNNISFGFLFLMALCGLIVMNSLIAIHVQRHMNRKSNSSDKTRTMEPLDVNELATIKKDNQTVQDEYKENENDNCKWYIDTSDDDYDSNITGNTNIDMCASEMSRPKQCSPSSHSVSTVEGRGNIKRKVISKNVREIKKRRTAFIMFLVYLAFIVSYLPVICILLIRTADKTFVPSLSDGERVVYKLFLMSCYINCAINPVIYGLWDNTFRKHAKKLICRK